MEKIDAEMGKIFESPEKSSEKSFEEPKAEAESRNGNHHDENGGKHEKAANSVSASGDEPIDAAKDDERNSVSTSESYVEPDFDLNSFSNSVPMGNKTDSASAGDSFETAKEEKADSVSAEDSFEETTPKKKEKKSNSASVGDAFDAMVTEKVPQVEKTEAEKTEIDWDALEKEEEQVDEKASKAEDAKALFEKEEEKETSKAEDDEEAENAPMDEDKEAENDEDEKAPDDDDDEPEVVSSTTSKPKPAFTQISDAEYYAALNNDELDWYAELGPKGDRVACQAVNCTACHKQITSVNANTVIRHPVLAVTVCSGCRIFYNDGNWSKDEDGLDEYCRWCAQGGDLILCDKCTNGFCKKCLQRNLGRKFVADLQKADEWKCLVCDPKPIYKLRAVYYSLSKVIAVKSKEESKDEDEEKPKATPRKRPSSAKATPKKGKAANFIDDNINDAFETLKIYQKALEDERKKWSRHASEMEAKNATNACKSLRRIYSITKQNMDLLDAALVQGFAEKFDDEDAVKIGNVSTKTSTLTPEPLKRKAAESPASAKKRPPAKRARPTPKKRSRPKAPSKAKKASSPKAKTTKVSTNLFKGKKKASKATVSESSDSDSDSAIIAQETNNKVTTPSLLKKKPKMGPKSKVHRN